MKSQFLNHQRRTRIGKILMFQGFISNFLFIVIFSYLLTTDSIIIIKQNSPTVFISILYGLSFLAGIIGMGILPPPIFTLDEFKSLVNRGRWKDNELILVRESKFDDRFVIHLLNYNHPQYGVNVFLDKPFSKETFPLRLVT